MQTVTDAATQLSGAKFGAFFYNVIDARGESFLLYTLSGAPREAFEKFGLPRNTPVFDPTFRGEGVVRSADITKDPRYGTMAPHYGMPKGICPVRSYLAVPVISRSGEVDRRPLLRASRARRVHRTAQQLVVGVAAQAAVAIDNARLYEAAQTRTRQPRTRRSGAARDRPPQGRIPRDARARAAQSAGADPPGRADLASRRRRPRRRSAGATT